MAATMNEGFLKCLNKSLENTRKIDYSKKGGWMPDNGPINLRLVGFEAEEATGDDGPYFFAASTFEILDGPSKGKTFRDRPMYFRDSDSQEDGPTIDQERICKLATVISGEEHFDAAQAAITITQSVGSVCLSGVVKRKVSQSNGQEYANLYINKKISG